MPCTVTPEEVAYYEKEHNLRQYGKEWTNAQLTTAVACWLAQHVNPAYVMPAYVAGWIEAHKKFDVEQDSIFQGSASSTVATSTKWPD